MHAKLRGNWINMGPKWKPGSNPDPKKIGKYSRMLAKSSLSRWLFLEPFRTTWAALAVIWSPTGSKGAPKMRQETPRTNRKGAWWSKMERQGIERNKKWADGCQREPKGRPTCIKKSIFGQGCESGTYAFWYGLGAIVHQNRCGNRCRTIHEKWWTIDAKMNLLLDTFRKLRPWTKTSFPKKVNVRKAYESSSRMRVREGLSKKKHIKKRGTSVKNFFKNRSRKRDAKSKNNLPNSYPKPMPKPWNKRQQIDAKKGER